MADAVSQRNDPLQDLYPAVCHLSIVAEVREGLFEAVDAVLAGYEIMGPLSAGGGTPSGRHCALRVSVRVASREDMETLDCTLRAIPGVRMIL